MTFYQKVKRALEAHQPITHERLAAEMGADVEATRLALIELKKRGKATADGSALHGYQEWRLR